MDYIYTIYIQSIYNLYTIYIQSIYNLYTIYIQSIYNLYTIYIQSIYNVHYIALKDLIDIDLMVNSQIVEWFHSHCPEAWHLTQAMPVMVLQSGSRPADGYPIIR